MFRSSGLRLLVAVFCTVFAVLCHSPASANVNFAHLTDPHLFDDKEGAEGNRQALLWCIQQVNQRAAGGTVYSFVAMTGDLGLEKLPGGERKDETVLANAAKDLAGIIGESSVKRWLFVPGNNDLFGEDPSTVQNFHRFIQDLQETLPAFTITDLCPRDDDPASGVYEEAGCRFLGFDNASFKSNDSGADALRFEPEQVKCVERALSRLKQGGDRPAFLFFHIPNMEDPFYAALDPGTPILVQRAERRKPVGDAYPLSAWTVTENVRQKWALVVADPHVKGMFAGHFHHFVRAAYDWERLPGEDPQGQSRLFVAPPIAGKRQTNRPLQARGFRDVSIDTERGEVSSAPIVWYQSAATPSVGSGNAGRAADASAPSR